MGTRLRADLSDHVTILGAVFDGDAAGPGQNDSQLRDRYGVNFRVRAELQVIRSAKNLLRTFLNC
jgi:porin